MKLPERHSTKSRLNKVSDLVFARVNPFFSLPILFLMIFGISDCLSLGTEYNEVPQAYHFNLQIYIQGEFDESQMPLSIGIEADLSNKWLIESGLWEEEISPGILIKDRYTEEYLKNNLVTISLILGMQYVGLEEINFEMTYITTIEEQLYSDSLIYGDKFDPEEILGFNKAFMSHSMLFNEAEGIIFVEVYRHSTIYNENTFTTERKIELIGKHEIHSFVLFSMLNYSLYRQIW